MDKKQYSGLTDLEVEERTNSGLVNYNDMPKTKTVGKIIRDNFFNYFNFLNKSCTWNCCILIRIFKW